MKTEGFDPTCECSDWTMVGHHSDAYHWDADGALTGHHPDCKRYVPPTPEEQAAGRVNRPKYRARLKALAEEAALRRQQRDAADFLIEKEPDGGTRATLRWRRGEHRRISFRTSRSGEPLVIELAPEEDLIIRTASPPPSPPIRFNISVDFIYPGA